MKKPGNSLLRIGLVLDDSLDRPDGVQQYVLTVGEWLKKRGHAVYYLVGDTTRSDIEGIRTLGRNWHVKFNHNTMSIPRPVPRVRIRHILEELNLDVLHVQIPYHPLSAGRVIQEAKHSTAIVGTFHILPASWTSAVGTKALAMIQKQTHQRFNIVTSTSPAARQFARTHYKLDSIVVPNPIDISAFAPTKPRSTPKRQTIVFLGRLVRRKGAQYLLAAINQLNSEVKLDNVRVVIGGKGELLKDLQTYVVKHHLQDIVEFRGFIPEQDKASLLHSADIAVFPAVNGESFGIVLLEAMASGAGVTLAGNNPGYRSVMQSIPESLFDPEHTSEFAQILDSFLHDSALANSVHTKQTKLVRQFDINIIGKRLESVYRGAVKKRR